MKRRPHRWCLQGSLLLLFLPFSPPISVVHFSFCCHYNRIKLAFAFICTPLFVRRSFNYSSMSLFFFFSSQTLFTLILLAFQFVQSHQLRFSSLLPQPTEHKVKKLLSSTPTFSTNPTTTTAKEHTHTHKKEKKKEHRCCCTNDVTCQHRQLLTCAVGVQRDAAPQHPPPQRR